MVTRMRQDASRPGRKPRPHEQANPARPPVAPYQTRGPAPRGRPTAPAAPAAPAAKYPGRLFPGASSATSHFFPSDPFPIPFFPRQPWVGPLDLTTDLSPWFGRGESPPASGLGPIRRAGSPSPCRAPRRASPGQRGCAARRETRAVPDARFQTAVHRVASARQPFIHSLSRRSLAFFDRLFPGRSAPRRRFRRHLRHRGVRADAGL